MAEPIIAVLEQLDQLEDIVLEGSRIPFSGGRLVNEQDAVEVIDALRDALPVQLNQAVELIRQREEFIEKARSQAEEIVAQGRREREQLIQTASVRQEAERQVLEMREQTRQQCEQLQMQVRQQVAQAEQDHQTRLAQMEQQFAARRQQLEQEAADRKLVVAARTNKVAVVAAVAVVVAAAAWPPAIFALPLVLALAAVRVPAAFVRRVCGAGRRPRGRAYPSAARPPAHCRGLGPRPFSLWTTAVVVCHPTARRVLPVGTWLSHASCPAERVALAGDDVACHPSRVLALGWG
jgi:hypothetical protein